jgi:hypothetical protein
MGTAAPGSEISTPDWFAGIIANTMLEIYCLNTAAEMAGVAPCTLYKRSRTTGQSHRLVYLKIIRKLKCCSRVILKQMTLAQNVNVVLHKYFFKINNQVLVFPIIFCVFWTLMI